MSKKIEFYFDFVSPTAYLAFHHLQALAEKYQAEIDFKGVLLGGVFKGASNTTPISVPAKGRYMFNDLPRFAKRYDIEMHINPFFPLNTMPLMRGLYAAQEMGRAMDYMNEVFDGMWKRKINFSKPEALIQVLKDLNIDEEKFQNLVSSDAIKNQLKETTQELVTRGGFGVPTMYLDNEMYFGQDRLDFVEEALSE